MGTMSISSPCLARLQSVCCSESEAGVQMLQHVQQGNVEPSRKVTPPSSLAKDGLALWPSQMISSCRGSTACCSRLRRKLQSRSLS
ncbi:hypothetical protein OJAV_G00153970 [Oryzias javanicus]|uniref:Uncharacterized protein n=1 Tax=Oryzias javanicus TaxID=123683 RepID=A0A3S2NZX3_ORYJA|nr:hypothetical protein OJAV_G00153970 [Oryzias javanicus]